jgi:serine/threonine-protein kinase RsbW
MPSKSPTASGCVLEIPPEAAYISTARLFVAAVARHFAVEEDSVEDLKLAVSEACNAAIRIRQREPEDRWIHIEGTRQGSQLVFDVEDALEAESSPIATSTEDIVRGLSLELIRALFPDAKTSPNPGGGTSVRLSLPVDESDPGWFDT